MTRKSPPPVSGRSRLSTARRCRTERLSDRCGCCCLGFVPARGEKDGRPDHIARRMRLVADHGVSRAHDKITHNEDGASKHAGLLLAVALTANGCDEGCCKQGNKHNK